MSIMRNSMTTIYLSEKTKGLPTVWTLHPWALTKTLKILQIN